MRNICITFVFLIFSFVFNAFANERTQTIKTPSNVEFCGIEDASWSPYGDTKCIKLYDAFKNFQNAQEVCSKSDARLATVTSLNEQTFLADYLFTQKQTADSVWLGAKFDAQSGRFQWQKLIEITNLTYNNWRSGYPTGTGNNCVQLIGGAGEGRGEWVNEPCSKGNRVLCERPQIWSFKKLQEMIQKLGKKLQFTIEELKTTKTKQEVTISKLKAVKNELNIAKDKNLAALEKLKQDTKAETDAKLQNVSKETENSLKEVRKAIAQPSLPVDFIYIQLAFQKTPDTLWPHYKWEDVTPQFKGAFLRALGTGSGPWNTEQGENAPRIDEVERGWCLLDDTRNYCDRNAKVGVFKHISPLNKVPVPKNGGWSPAVWTVKSYAVGPEKNKNRLYEPHFSDFHWYHSTGGEIRPRNVNFKVWKRK